MRRTLTNLKSEGSSSSKNSGDESRRVAVAKLLSGRKRRTWIRFWRS